MFFFLFCPSSLTNHQQKLNNFTRVPDYIAYLSYILACMPEQDDRIRSIAAYLLKNNARLILRCSPEAAAFVKAAILHAFNEAAPHLRTTAGQDIVAFLGALEPRNWPECLEHLLNLLDSPDIGQQEVSTGVGLCPRVATSACPPATFDFAHLFSYLSY